MGKRLTTKEFIEKARKVHGDKYDYSEVVYKNSRTKIKIICSEHGVFEQKPDNHITKKQNCPKCGVLKQANTVTMSTEEFIEKARKVHGNKYDYSKVVYKKSKIRVLIGCKVHGYFQQKPNTHLNGSGCLKCSGKEKLTTKTFIEKARKIHGDRYNYLSVVSNGADTDVVIVCRIHGKFCQTPKSHLSGRGCLKCGGKEKLTTKTFIERAKLVHGNKYDYSKVNYINNYTKIKIICKVHGEYEQLPRSHYNSCQGCPKCNTSKGEKVIIKALDSLGILFEKEKKFKDCMDKQLLRFDFFLPEQNILIEYDGKQHFEPRKFSSNVSDKKAEEVFNNIKRRDQIKNKYAKDNGIKLIRIPYYDFDRIEEILKDAILSDGCSSSTDESLKQD